MIVGDNPGSKVAKAEKLGVPLLAEEALVELLVGLTPWPGQARRRGVRAPGPGS